MAGLFLVPDNASDNFACIYNNGIGGWLGHCLDYLGAPFALGSDPRRIGVSYIVNGNL
jgi:hypothetical protein